MSKKDLKLHSVVAPTPTIVAAAYDENGRPDVCTLAFFAICSHVPPCVMIAINATLKRKTLQSILKSGAFTVGYPSADQVREADYFGVESGYNADKLKNAGFTAAEGRAVHAPVINEIPLSLECKVVHTVTVGSHTQIIGEIKNIQAEESILNENGKILLDKLKPIIYDEEEFVYYGLGERVAYAFKTGAAFKKELAEKDGE